MAPVRCRPPQRIAAPAARPAVRRQRNGSRSRSASSRAAEARGIPAASGSPRTRPLSRLFAPRRIPPASPDIKDGYLRAITRNGETLGQYNEGPNSGWLYKVNGKAPNVGIADYQLKAARRSPYITPPITPRRAVSIFPRRPRAARSARRRRSRMRTARPPRPRRSPTVRPLRPPPSPTAARPSQRQSLTAA